MAKIVPWHDDRAGSYKGAYIVPEEDAETMEELGEGHWISLTKTWSKAEYAFNAGKKIIDPNYFFLVKIEEKGLIRWTVLLTKNPVETAFTSILLPET